MSGKFIELLNTSTLVADGAMGTMLQKYGLLAGSCPEEYNLRHPDIVQNIHQQYFAAGADLVETNTFGANRFRLSFHGYGEQVKELNRRAAELACAVRPAGKFVAGSVGPTGELLEPLGSLTFTQLVDAFYEQMAALQAGGVDLIIIETLADLQEARAALQAAKNLTPVLPVAVTMTFDRGAAGFKTMMGISPLDLISALAEAGADLIGANCGLGMEEMIDLMTEIRGRYSAALIAQANAGLPRWDGQKNIYSETPAQRGQATTKLLELKVNIIGGCCGTTPDHIHAIREAVDAYAAAVHGKKK
jgi:5-methyltetrahydrofolate--homocysteine methyltransferase